LDQEETVAQNETLQTVMEEAALAAAKELRDFLKSPKGEIPTSRVNTALGTLSGYTRWRASQNNLISMMLGAARQANLPAEIVTNISEEVGLIPEKSARRLKEK
jgi:hypothetical protein